jgi:hypothetical protein
MPHGFRTQAEYYLRLAELAGTPEEKARLVSVACRWHRLAQQLDLHDAQVRDGGTKEVDAQVRDIGPSIAA